MRYQNEIEEILKFSKEFGCTILNKYYVLQANYQEGIWKNNDLASLGHKLATMSTLFKYRNEIVRFVQDLQKREKNLTSNFSLCSMNYWVTDISLQYNFFLNTATFRVDSSL